VNLLLAWIVAAALFALAAYVLSKAAAVLMGDE
jgi:hypothetical protein